MRFTSLSYKHFGPFVDVKLDVSQGTHGLHIIYGPNEAGKTTALRGLGYFLFGFPHGKCDDFRYNSSEQRIGAALRSATGKELTCIRRRGKVGTLRAADDREVVDNHVLGDFVGGISADQFDMLFGLNHVQLIDGGHEILRGRGGLGEALFAAGAGLAGLRRIDQRLATRIDDLYKPKGQNQLIAVGLRNLGNTRDELRSKMLQVDAWTAEEEKLRQSLERKSQLEKERTTNRSEILRLESYRSALPTIQTLQDLQGQLAPLCEFRLLDEKFAQDHRSAVAELDAARIRRDAAKEALKRLNDDLCAKVPSGPVLAEAQAIERLQGQLSVCLKAERDSLGLEANLREYEDKSRQILRTYFSKEDLEDAKELRLSPAEEERIRALGEARGALLRAVEDVRARLEQLDIDIGEREQQVAAIIEPPDTTIVDSLASSIILEGPLEANHREAADTIAANSRKAAAALKQLSPVWSGDLNELSDLTTPLLDRVQAYQREFADTDEARRDLNQRHKDRETTVRERTRQIQRLTLSEHIPTENDLAEARADRDSGVEHAGNAVIGRSEESSAEAAFVNRFAPGQRLIDALKESIRKCDELADRMRRESGRVAELSLYQDEQRAAKEDSDSLLRQIQSNAEDQSKLQQSWQLEWQPSGIVPKSPSEMTSWLQQLAQLREQVVDLALAADQRERQRQRIEELRGALARAIGLVGENTNESLAQLLEITRIQGAAAAKERLARATLVNDIAALRRSREREERKLANANQRVKEWRQDWASAVRVIGLDPDQDPAAAYQYMKQLAELFQGLRLAAEIALRLKGIAHDREQFLASLQALRIRLDGESRAPSTASTMQTEVDGLVRRLNEARQLRSQRDVIQAEADRAKAAVEGAEHLVGKLEATLRSLRDDASVACEDHIPAAIDKSNERRRLQAMLEQVRANLHQQARGQPLESFITDAQAAREGLDVRLAELQDCVQPLDDAINGQAILADSANCQLEEWRKASAAAAESKQEMESQIAELRDQIAEFASVNLARQVLKLTIERYRKRNQGSMLGRAAHFFGRLTDMAFNGLEVDEDEDGKPRLWALRANPGEQVPVTGLSDGTRDQLFLALRLAGIEKHLTSREPMPLVVDDILVNFDERRATATLGCLAELSRQTQILLFTHHTYLLELAEKSLSDEVVYFQNIAETV